METAKIRVQLTIRTRRFWRAVPLPLKQVQDTRFAVHPVLHITFEHRSGGLTVGAACLAGSGQHSRSCPGIAPFPGDVAPEKPRVCYSLNFSE